MKKILLQLDVDPQPCSFDAIVAIDAGADILLRHGDVSPDNVVSLIHGAMFTRGASDLSSTSISLGGKNIPQVEAIASQISKTFFKSVRVSVFIDPAVQTQPRQPRFLLQSDTFLSKPRAGESMSRSCTRWYWPRGTKSEPASRKSRNPCPSCLAIF